MWMAFFAKELRFDADGDHHWEAEGVSHDEKAMMDAGISMTICRVLVFMAKNLPSSR